MRNLDAVALVLALLPMAAAAGEVDVVAAAAATADDGRYRFEATLRHPDSGRDHYADRWQVLAPDGRVLGTRVLHHPHVNEKPFTRSLSGIMVPAEVTRVRIRAHDSVHGLGGAEFELELSR